MKKTHRESKAGGKWGERKRERERVCVKGGAVGSQRERERGESTMLNKMRSFSEAPDVMAVDIKYTYILDKCVFMKR